MTTSKRTGGEWINFGSAELEAMIGLSSVHYGPDERASNRCTMRIAGTTANRLDALGYNGDECIRRLPEIVEAIETLMCQWPILGSDLIEPHKLLASLKS